MRNLEVGVMGGRKLEISDNIPLGWNNHWHWILSTFSNCILGVCVFFSTHLSHHFIKLTRSKPQTLSEKPQ